MGTTRIISSGRGREWSARPEAAGPMLAHGWPDFLDGPLASAEPPAGLELVKRGRGRAVFRFNAAGRT
ncbi:MAG: hypothetical protein WBD14_12195, partial [Phycisphaerae bacterium]